MIGLSFFFFQLYLIAFPFGQLAKIPTQGFFPEGSMYLTDFFLALSLFFGAGDIFGLLRKKIIPRGWVIFSLVGILGLGLGLQKYLPAQVFIGGLYLLRWWLYLGVIALTALFIQKKVVRRTDLLKMMIGAGVATVIFGFVQYFVWPDLRTFEVVQWDPHYYRIVGSFLDPGFTGLIFVLVFLLLLYFMVIGKRKMGSIKWLLLVVYGGLALTYSRSSYLAFLVGLLVWSKLKKDRRYFLYGLVCLALTVLILPRPAGEGVRLERISTIRARLINYYQSATIFLDQPLTGVGFNLYRYAQKQKGYLGADWQVNHAGAGADSSLLLVAATTGIVGLVGYLAGWVTLIRKKLAKSQRFLFFPSLIAVLAHSFFLNSQFYPWVLGWMGVLIGLSFKNARSER